MYSPKVESPIYSPTMQSPNLGSPKPDPYASKYNTEMVSKTQYGGQQNGASPYGGNQYGGSNATANVPAGGGKKKVFGLNVSDEFTNSFTIKKMAEPFKSNVTSIKSRARQYRNSLSTYLK